MTSRILLVEDEPGLVITVFDLLTGDGYQVDTARDGEAGWLRRPPAITIS
jgi:DNA-binding response OmpR family regulator